MAGRERLLAYIQKTYGALPDYPWARTPRYAVLRHANSRKWFAAIVDVAQDKLGMPGSRVVDAVNLKCGPQMAGALRGQPGVFPGWHMNKENWVTVLLDGPMPMDEIRALVDLSYQLTAGRR